MQYIVKESDINKRIDFYNDILARYELKDLLREFDIESGFPFVVDFDKKTLWVCNSITCLAAASQCGKIITIDEFEERMNQKKLRKQV